MDTIVFFGICLLTGICTFIVARPIKPKRANKEQPDKSPKRLEGGGGNLTCEQKEQLIEVDQTICVYQAAVRMVRAGRGEEAYAVLRQTNAYNTRPQEGKEYLIVMLEVEVKAIQSGTGPINISPFDVECQRDNGQTYGRKSIITPRPALRGAIQPGMTLAGWLAFEIDQNDDCPQIIYGQDFEGKGGARFSLVPKED